MLPNAITLGNIALGLLGILAATEGRFLRACVMLTAAAICDLVDGRLARVLDATSKFGGELDSLSDMVSFGLAPAVLLYLAVLKELGWLGAAIAAAYVLTGAIRLARFNVDTNELSQHTFQGCPIPVAAGYLVSFVIVRQMLPVWLIAVGTLWVAGCMVSTLKVPKLRRGQLPLVMLFIGLGSFLWFLARPSALTWHVWNGWNVVLIASNYVMLHRRGHLKPRTEAPSLKRAA